MAWWIAAGTLLASSLAAGQPIDRRALVSRHNVVVTEADPRCPLQVGNGEFAFSADVTGLQTFPGFHAKGIPLCTLSHWAWHSTPIPAGLRREDIRTTPFDTYGRPVGYVTDAKGQEALYTWLRENPHGLHLGRLGLEMRRADGTPVAIEDLKNVRQEQDLWSGLLTSRFEVEGRPVRVETCGHPSRDAVAARIESPLLAEGRLRVVLAFPYGSPQPAAADWGKPDAHQTVLTRPGATRADFARTLDADTYAASLGWSEGASLTEEAKHTYALSPAPGAQSLEVTCAFSPKPDASALPGFAAVKAEAARHWQRFWSIGGAIDLSGSKDPRWRELERRIVLSQYLTAVNSAGSLPPQETGLVSNSWYGKFHLEMYWWHAAHFALWGRWPLLERSLGYYRQILPRARELAESQGYRGLRWPKMVGPDGRDAPSGTGPLLVWQQPHPIYFAELDYRLHPSRATLAKWQEVVFGTADFLASYAVRDAARGQYLLGPPMKTVSENTDPRTTRNPLFELSYWRFGLRVAQSWRERLGMPRSPQWDEVLKGLAPLPAQDGFYLMQEGMADTYTRMNWEHPALIGAYGMLPGDGVDPATMRATLRKVMECWQWDRCWGWDFPMVAMAAARVGEPELAIQALLTPSERKNTYQLNGFCRGGPNPYFPGNGGVLWAAAMMAAGWDGAPNRHAPGFPDDGQWVVRWEGLERAP